MAERFDTRCVTEIKSEDLEPVAPLGEVGFAGVPKRRVTGEPGGDDERGPRPEELDAGLVADLHPSAGQQRDPPAEVGRLGPLGVVEVPTRRTELVVEGVQLRELLLAHVAVPRIAEVASSQLGAVTFKLICFDELRREDVRGREDGLGSLAADPGLGEDGFVPRQLARPLAPLARPHPLAAKLDVGTEHVAGRVQQLDPLLLGEHREHRGVDGDRSQLLGERAEARGEREIVRAVVTGGARCRVVVHRSQG